MGQSIFLSSSVNYLCLNFSVRPGAACRASLRENLNDQRLSRGDSVPYIAYQDWVDGRQTARLLGLRDHDRQKADQTAKVPLRDGDVGALAGANRVDRALHLTQDQQGGR